MDKNYDPESLRLGIESCKKNITTFEEAIRKEEDTIRQFREWIRKIEEKKIKSETINQHVKVEVVKDGDRR